MPRLHIRQEGQSVVVRDGDPKKGKIVHRSKSIEAARNYVRKRKGKQGGTSGAARRGAQRAVRRGVKR